MLEKELEWRRVGLLVFEVSRSSMGE
jgi:hypothetical protein